MVDEGESASGFGLRASGRKKPLTVCHLKKENPPFIPLYKRGKEGDFFALLCRES
jgi:hypothetical protein